MLMEPVSGKGSEVSDPQTSRFPRVSIGLVVFNSERYLEQAVNAILQQTFRDFELIISDNGSTDRTEAICRAFASQDHRIRYHRHPENLGVAANYNGTVHMARGELFRWATYDDLMAPRNLEKCLEALDQHADAVLAYPKTIDIDDGGNTIGFYEDEFSFTDPRPHRRFRDLMKRVQNYDCNAEYGVIRRSILLQTGMEADYHSADKVLLAELVLHGKFVEVPERLYYHRLHQNISTRDAKKASEWNAWFNPSLVGKRSYPRIRRFVEFFRAINRAPLSLYQRMYCYVHVGLFYLSLDKWQRLFARVRRGLSSRFRASSEQT